MWLIWFAHSITIGLSGSVVCFGITLNTRQWDTHHFMIDRMHSRACMIGIYDQECTIYKSAEHLMVQCLGYTQQFIINYLSELR